MYTLSIMEVTQPTKSLKRGWTMKNDVICRHVIHGKSLLLRGYVYKQCKLVDDTTVSIYVCVKRISSLWYCTVSITIYLKKGNGVAHIYVIDKGLPCFGDMLMLNNDKTNWPGCTKTQQNLATFCTNVAVQSDSILINTSSIIHIQIQQLFS